MQYLKYAVIPIILGIIIISCEKDDSSVYDPILHFPTLSDPTFTPSSFDSDTINAVATARVSSVEPIKQVSVTLINPDGVGEAAIQLKDDGIAPDVTAGDGIYSASVFHVKTCRIIGSWRADFIAENESGLFSNTDNKNFTVTRTNNQPPIVSDIVIVPDSSHVNVDNYFIFMISATDPNGSCDIRRVFYTGLRPDNSELSPLDLYDDGSCCVLPPFSSTSGDTAAGDGKYTRKTFGKPLQTGYYRYYIRAIDRKGDTSNVLTDSIYVYP